MNLPKAWLLSLPIAIVLNLTQACGALENRFLYFPETALNSSPEDLNLPFEPVWFSASDGLKIHGWFVPGSANQPVILFCHGNAGNISHRLDNLYQFHLRGYSVLIFDYRGYGKSAGTPTEQGLYADARGALHWLLQRGLNKRSLVFFGRSLGAAVALNLALEHPPAALVLESPFTSVSAMGRYHNPLLTLLLGWSLKDRYDNLDKISHLKAPLLVIHGEKDRIVPLKMARRLFSRAPSPKTFYLLREAGHNDTLFADPLNYWDQWTTFLNQHISRDSTAD